MVHDDDTSRSIGINPRRNKPPERRPRTDEIGDLIKDFWRTHQLLGPERIYDELRARGHDDVQLPEVHYVVARMVREQRR